MPKRALSQADSSAAEAHPDEGSVEGDQIVAEETLDQASKRQKVVDDGDQAPSIDSLRFVALTDDPSAPSALRAPKLQYHSINMISNDVGVIFGGQSKVGGRSVSSNVVFTCNFRTGQFRRYFTSDDSFLRFLKHFKVDLSTYEASHRLNAERLLAEDAERAAAAAAAAAKQKLIDDAAAAAAARGNPMTTDPDTSSDDDHGEESSGNAGGAAKQEGGGHGDEKDADEDADAENDDNEDEGEDEDEDDHDEEDDMSDEEEESSSSEESEDTEDYFEYNVEVVEKGSAAPLPVARGGHVAFVHSNELYVFGGSDYPRFVGDMWALDLARMSWRQVDYTDASAWKSLATNGIGGHSGVFHGGSLWTFGGSDAAFTYCGDLHRFDLSTRSWHLIAPRGGTPAPAPRNGHAAAAWGSAFMVVFGGMSMSTTRVYDDEDDDDEDEDDYSDYGDEWSGYYDRGYRRRSYYEIVKTYTYHNDVHLYHFSTNTWIKVDAKPSTGGKKKPAPAPHRRAGAALLVCPRTGRLLVHSGSSKSDSNATNYYQDAWLFDVLSRAWEKVSVPLDWPFATGHKLVPVLLSDDTALVHMFGGGGAAYDFYGLQRSKLRLEDLDHMEIGRRVEVQRELRSIATSASLTDIELFVADVRPIDAQCDQDMV